MGNYISNNISTSAGARLNNNNNRKKKNNPSTSLASYFYIGGKRYDLVLVDQNQFLFGDNSDLSFIFTSKPVKVRGRASFWLNYLSISHF